MISAGGIVVSILDAQARYFIFWGHLSFYALEVCRDSWNGKGDGGFENFGEDEAMGLFGYWIICKDSYISQVDR